MLFNSIEYFIFLPIVFFIYWFLTNKNLKFQNSFIVLASFVFYGWWDWRFLSLILISIIEDYFVALKIHETDNEKKRKLWLFVSVAVNIGILGFFKYHNFFIENFINAFSLFGLKPNITSLNIILPVGISFYTFQTMSYTIDVYNRKLEPTKDFIAFAAFVSFFPLLVAGPIERATNLLSQFFKQRMFEYSKAIDGTKQILWGLFKKVAIADNCASYVNYVFDNFQEQSILTLIFGGVFFAFQVYCDFSGYSDIAIGTARLFGFSAMRNFNYPFFSRDIAEFWRRWHISLSTWFRDYVYIPLGGSRVSKIKVIRNIFVMYLLSGFWHGANWNFVLWGFYNAVLFLPLVILNINRKYINIVAHDKTFPNFKEMFQMLFTFILFVVGLIIFRSSSVANAFIYLSQFTDISCFNFIIYEKEKAFYLILGIIFIITIEWFGRSYQYGLEKLGLQWKPIFKYTLYYSLVISIILFSGNQLDFIYFQF